jgi:hypothetical protein
MHGQGQPSHKNHAKKIGTAAQTKNLPLPAGGPRAPSRITERPIKPAGLLAWSSTPVHRQIKTKPSKATAQNVREIPYDSVPNFLKLPAGEYLGEIGNMRVQKLTLR